VPGVLKGASDLKTSQSRAEGELLGDDGVGGGVGLSCEKTQGGRMVVVPMVVFESFVDIGKQPLDNVSNFPIFQRIIGQDVAWI
jgi:hypothetical protein